MTRRYRLFLILIGIALASAGLPVHACPYDASQEAGKPVDAETIAAVDTGCPFHAVKSAGHDDPASETNQADSESGSCFLDCGCGCGAPVPASMTALGSEAAPDHGTAIAPPGLFDPCSSPERLLRPPQPWA